MVNGKKEYFPSYGSSVEVARDLANSSATYRSNHANNYVNSSQHIKIESSGVGKLSVDSNAAGGGGAAGYGSSNQLNTRYGNNVQITTSRITTDKGELGSGGQITSSRYEGGSSGIGNTNKNTMNIGSTTTGTRGGGYQFY